MLLEINILCCLQKIIMLLNEYVILAFFFRNALMGFCGISSSLLMSLAHVVRMLLTEFSTFCA